MKERPQEKSVRLDMVFEKSQDIVAREIQGEFIIIPITSGIGDADDDIFALNKTAKAVWAKIDGKKGLGAIAQELFNEFNFPLEQIEKDVLGLAEELSRRNMIIRA